MRHIILFGTLLALSACNNNASQNETAANDGDTQVTSADQAAAGSVAATQDSEAMNPTDPASYVDKAGASDKWEIDASQAILASTKSAEIKKFAQMMVNHHTRASEKLMASAKSGKLSVGPPQLDAMQQSMLDDIKNAESGDRDSMYLKHQQTAHIAALALHQNFAANGTNDILKKTASEMIGVVKSHISELQKLASMGNKASQGS